MTTRIYTVTVTAEQHEAVIDSAFRNAVVSVAEELDEHGRQPVSIGVLTYPEGLHITAYNFDPEEG